MVPAAQAVGTTLRFSGSDYLSTDAVARQPRFAGGDLTRPDVLRDALASRVFKNELILFVFDFCAVQEAINLVLMLRRAGFEHFLPVADGAATCDALVAAAVRGGVRDVPCGWTSWASRQPGWASWGSGPHCVSAAARRRVCTIEQLWAARYDLAGSVLARGTSLLFLDLDMALLRDPYLPLKRELGGYGFVFLQDTGGAIPANGGLWYAQHARAGVGAQWVVAEVGRRMEALLRVPLARKRLPPLDQTLLSDALATAAHGGAPNHFLMCEHGSLRSTPLCAGNLSDPPYPRRLRLRTVVRARSPYGSSARAAGGRRRRGLSRFPDAFVVGNLTVRGAPGPDHRVARAPGWLFPRGWDAQRTGAFGARASAVVHLLGVRCRWCLDSEDWDKGAKWEWQQLAGFWDAKAYANATPLLGDTAVSDAEAHCKKRGARAGRWAVAWRSRGGSSARPASPACARERLRSPRHVRCRSNAAALRRSPRDFRLRPPGQERLACRRRGRTGER